MEYNVSTMKEKIQKARILKTGEINPKDPDVIDADFKEVEKEIGDFSPEDKEKIKFGWTTFGFWVEKKKDDYFADVFDKSLSKIDKKGTTGRFCTELRDRFVRNSKEAAKKANEASAFSDTKLGINIKGKKRGVNISAGEKKAISNFGNFSGNFLKYGRLIFDATGITIGSANRVAMAVGMATAVLAEAGKEARLKNEEVIEKTRIQDVDLAYDEAKKIYERAQVRGKTENVSAEALKNAYMMEMPKDLQERLKRPDVANGFWQKWIKKDLESGLFLLNKNIEKIEKNQKFSPEQKEVEKEKLITKQKKNLEDYDRIITQYGTVDMASMVLRYTQTAGKATVAVLQVETLFIGADKICETMSNFYHHFHDAGKVFTFNVSDPRAFSRPMPHNVEPMPAKLSTAQIPVNEPLTEPGPTVSPDAIVHQGQGIEHPLIRQIENNSKLAQELGFKGEVNDKIALHKFAQGEAHRVAIKMGYVGKDGQELRITEANRVAFELKTENGQPIVIEKINGKIIYTYDSEKEYEFGKNPNNPYEKEVTATHPKLVHQEIKPVPTETPPTEEEILKRKIGEIIDNENKGIEKQIQTDEEGEQIEKNIDTETEKTNTADSFEKKPGLGYQEVRTGTTYSVGSKVGVGMEVPVGSEIGVGSKVGVNSEISVGSRMSTGNSYGNQIEIGGDRYHLDSQGQYHDWLGKQYFPEISPEENAILQHHPEFADNPFNLSGEKLIQAYEIHESNISHIFPKDTRDVWDAVSRGPTKEMLSTKETEAEEGLSPFISYLHKLKEITGLKPKGGIIFRNETNGEYVTRALQKATSLGKLEELKQF